MEELRSFLLQLGITEIDKLLPNQGIIRFNWKSKKKDGWFVGFINNYVNKSGQYVVAVVDSWTINNRQTYMPEKISRDDMKVVKAQLEDAQKKAALETVARQVVTGEKTEKILARAKDSGTHPYLERKGFTELYGAKILFGVLYIPTRDLEGKITGAQRIFDTGEKRFMAGQKSKDVYHVIGSMDDPEIFLCEGFATGVSIHMATKKTVVIAFSASNLKGIAVGIKQLNPDAELVICGDDDRFKPENAGRSQAELAARASQAAIVFPRFRSHDTHPTDFNDLHLLEGIEEVQRQLFAAPPIEEGFIPLGYNEKTYFYYHIKSCDIVRILGFSKNELLQIAPLSFWEARYPMAKGDRVDWLTAMNDLIQTCRAKGPFDTSRVRGSGVWHDDGRFVVNTGKRLSVDRRDAPLNGIQSNYIYTRTLSDIRISYRPLSLDECRPILDIAESLHWNDPRSAYYVCGWIAIARSAGALPIRPHIWLTGASAAGKSTLINQFIKPLLGGERGFNFAQGSTTEAGLRQQLKSTSMPVVFDEFESSNPATEARYDASLELLRSCWSETGGQVIKGSASGTSVSYTLAFSALVSSIGVTLKSDQDKSRFSVLELGPHGDDTDEWKRLKAALKKIDVDLGDRLFARIIGMLPVILESYENFSDAIAALTRQRAGQQIGMLMAGYWALRSDDPVDVGMAQKIAEELSLQEDEGERLTEEMACLNHLLTSTVRLDEGQTNETASIEQVIFEKSDKSDAYTAELRKYGILIQDGALYVAESHSYLHKLFAGTRWSNWTCYLRRIKGAKKTKPKYFIKSECSYRCTEIPFDAFM